MGASDASSKTQCLIMSRDSIAIVHGYSGNVRARNRPFLALGVATLAFVVLALWVESGNSIAFDLAIREAFHQIASPGLTHCEVAITTLGAGIVLWPLGAAVAWWMARRRGRRHAILFLLTVLSADLVSQLLKLGFHRVRPQVYFGLSPAWSYSFPSGHALMSTVFYGALAALGFQGRSRTRTLVVALAALGGLLIGMSESISAITTRATCWAAGSWP